MKPISPFPGSRVGLSFSFSTLHNAGCNVSHYVGSSGQGGSGTPPLGSKISCDGSAISNGGSNTPKVGSEAPKVGSGVANVGRVPHKVGSLIPNVDDQTPESQLGTSVDGRSLPDILKSIASDASAISRGSDLPPVLGGPPARSRLANRDWEIAFPTTKTTLPRLGAPLSRRHRLILAELGVKAPISPTKNAKQKE